MAAGALVGTSGGVKVGPSGAVQSTNAGGTCPTCGCGDEPTGEWPEDGWIECTPCPGEPALTVVAVMSVAAIRQNAQNFYKGIIPWKCLVGSVVEPSLGVFVCVSAKPGNAVRTSSVGCSVVDPPSLTSGYYYTCCDCRSSTTCREGSQIFPITGVAPGISVSVSMPLRRRSPGTTDAFAEYRCCCPRIGNGIIQQVSGEVHWYEHDGPFTRDYVPPPNFLVDSEEWDSWSWSGSISSNFGGVVTFTHVHRLRRVKYDGTVEDNTTTSSVDKLVGPFCGSFAAVAYTQGWIWGGNPGQPTATGCFAAGLIGGNVVLGSKDPIAGSVAVSCNAMNFTLSQTGRYADDHTQYPIRVEHSATETSTSSDSASCGSGCEDAGALAVPSLAVLDGAWR